ncbi:MAG: hypothetical protein IT205_09235 [Fimbriimonadaceae bacterium]|nr:hypothetical protein [Fimbriimonadaceae bacterium]
MPILRIMLWMELLFTGADHLEWLQGQITNDVRQLPCRFGICNPNGTLAGLGELRDCDEGTLANGNELSMLALEDRVKTHVILEDVNVVRITSAERADLPMPIELGIPIFGVDTGPRTLLLELGSQVVASHLSTIKGCYVGQEILHRIHARGKTKTVWSGLLSEEVIEPGHYDSVWVTRSEVSPMHGPIAAAYVPRGLEDILIRGISARVVELPL